MKKRKLLLTFAASGLVATTAAAILASGGIKVNPFANDSETWTHYSGIGSTIYERGSKEYWVSCSSHSHQFTAPASGNIQEGTEAANFQNALELDDDRLIRNKSSFDFEDGNYDVIDQAGSVNINSFQIVNEGVNGSKALKANNSAYVTGRGIKFKKAWLDMAFANSGTEAILFDVLSSVATKYFGYKTNGVYNRYEADDSNTGVSPYLRLSLSQGRCMRPLPQSNILLVRIKPLVLPITLLITLGSERLSMKLNALISLAAN